MSSVRQPAIFLPHGGGPCFWIDAPPQFGRAAWMSLRRYLESIVPSLPDKPKAFLVCTAHWEAESPTVSVNPSPGMLYDYFNFPPHTYLLKYPAPGAPDIAQRAKEMIGEAGIEAGADAERGYDHGVFVPMLIVDPEAQIPVVMLSLKNDLDPELHIRVGRALAPLRDEGVAILGSGMSYHNLRNFRDGDGRASEVFDAWLCEAATASPGQRDQKLIRWDEAPAARFCHPREEHLLPLMVVAGAAVESRGEVAFRDAIGGKTISAFRYG
jgi:aromatic ring-opening dioxygenase catalytic subunit (LigB family)